MALDTKVQVYAVIRIDDADVGTPQVNLTVKEILPGLSEAEMEVERLNRLNAEKGCRYFWQATRYYPEGRKKQPKPRLKLVRRRTRTK